MFLFCLQETHLPSQHKEEPQKRLEPVVDQLDTHAEKEVKKKSHNAFVSWIRKKFSKVNIL